MVAPLYIFVSHSSRDNEFGLTLVEHLHKMLEAEGQRSIIWYDITHIHPGDSWPQKISEALNDCTIFLLIMSPDAMNSEWTNKECSIALACNKLIIPILWRKCDIWPMVKHIQYIDFSDPSAFQSRIATLYGTISDATGQSSKPLPARQPDQSVEKNESLPQENLMHQMLDMIQKNLHRQSWDEIILSTNMLITTFGRTIPSIYYYMRGIAFLQQHKLQEADEALSLALSTVANDRDLRLKCLKARINTLRAMGGHAQEVLLLAQDALRLDPHNSDWIAIEERATEEAEEEKREEPRPPVPPPPIPLPAPKPFSISWLTFEGHQGTVCDLVWSPDRHYLASAGADGKVYIWEIKRAEDDPVEQPPFIYNGHTRRVNAVDWSPDGLFLASASRDQTVQIWRINRDTPVAPPRKHGDWVNDVAWSPDSTLIASACNDRKVRIWNTKTQAAHEDIFPHTSEVHCVGWSPDGKYIASGCLDGRIYIWDVTDKKQINILKGSKECIYDLVWMPDGQRLAAASADQTVRIWHNVTAEFPSFMSRPAETTANFIENKHDHPVFALTRSRRGRRIASTDGHLVRVWYTATRSQIFTNPVHNGRVWAVAWAPDDKHIASAGSDRLIQVWSIVEDQDTLP